MATRKSTSKARGSRNRPPVRANDPPVNDPSADGPTANGPSTDDPSNDRGTVAQALPSARPIAQSPLAALEDIIEDERLRLMKAHSILSCATIAMEESDAEQGGPYYPAIIDLARELIDETVRRLDSVKLKPLLQPLRDAQRR